MQVKVKGATLSYDYVKRVPQLVLELADSLSWVEQEIIGIKKGLDDGKRVLAEIKVQKPRRSLDSNAYCWVLMNRIAEKTGIDVETVYRETIKGIGGNCEIVCVTNEAVERLRSGWSQNGIGWVSDTMESKLDGCTNVVLYYGSSTYDQGQMGRLIDRIVHDCHTLGIETMTPQELMHLKQGWGV